jgi:tetratricopeptide (TPR) repeat protein
MKKTRAKPAALEATSYDFDVFVSYASKDKAWVRGELLKRIEKAGIRAFIDFRDFTRGAPGMKEMERGVTRCRKTLLVLTPAYIKSEWGEIELRMGQTLGPANRDPRLIPLLKKKCDKPLSIETLTHIDFTDGADLDLAWRQLLTALGAPPDLPDFIQPSRDQWYLAHPYAMPPNFTGRLAERAMLTDWLTRDAVHPLLVLRALGGFGKSALTWHWLLHDVDPSQWPRVVWWSFYEGDASFESFFGKTLQYLGGARHDTSALSASPREQLVALLRMLQSGGMLLILDGFERALRAFGGLGAAYQGDETVIHQGGERDCLSPMADAFLRNVANLPGINGKVLLTTRLRPASVETRGGILLQGCREEELVQLQPADAAEFFHAQGVRGGRAEIEAACEPYGYHPLSLRLLAGLIVGDIQQPGDVAAAQRLDVGGDLVQHQHHVIEQAYINIGPARQRLLSRIACFRSPVSYDALRAFADTELQDPDAMAGGVVQTAAEKSLDADLRDLIARGLLHRDLGTNRFDLHPIVRRYAYDRLAVSDRADTHGRLRDYFAAVPGPDKMRSLDDLAPVIELYHHTVRAGQYDEAYKLFRDRLDTPTYYQFGAYQLQIELLRALFPDGESRVPRLKEESAQATTLNDLACVYSLTGQPRIAVSLFERQIAIRERQGNKKNIGVGLANLGDDRLHIGALQAAEVDLRRSIMLCRESNSSFNEAISHRELGRVLAHRGAWAESETELDTALDMFSENNLQSRCVVWADRALLMLFRLRCATARNDLKSEIVELKSAVAPGLIALELAEERARTSYPVEIDYIHAYSLLGTAYRLAGSFDEAERHLNQALERCRRINNLESEAHILIDLAWLRGAAAAPDEAQRLAEEALVITERCGYVLQSADAHLVLAQLAKDSGDAKSLREHATEALRLATCDGPPDYTYKAAYDEATALLK